RPGSGPAGRGAPPNRLARGSTSDVRHLERLALDRLLDQAAADGADGDADRLDRAVDLDLDPLEVREEPPLGGAGDLAADAAEVFGLAAVALLVAADGLLAGNRTLHAHDAPSSTDGRWK